MKLKTNNLVLNSLQTGFSKSTNPLLDGDNRHVCWLESCLFKIALFVEFTESPRTMRVCDDWGPYPPKLWLFSTLGRPSKRVSFCMCVEIKSVIIQNLLHIFWVAYFFFTQTAHSNLPATNVDAHHRCQYYVYHCFYLYLYLYHHPNANYSKIVQSIHCSCLWICAVLPSHILVHVLQSFLLCDQANYLDLDMLIILDDILQSCEHHVLECFCVMVSHRWMYPWVRF